VRLESSSALGLEFECVSLSKFMLVSDCFFLERGWEGGWELGVGYELW
jgi:hypothetical protein